MVGPAHIGSGFRSCGGGLGLEGVLRLLDHGGKRHLVPDGGVTLIVARRPIASGSRGMGEIASAPPSTMMKTPVND